MRVEHKNRQYNMIHVENFVRSIQRYILVKSPEAEESCSCYVLEKGTEARGPKFLNESVFFKDGVHLVFPRIFLNEGSALKLRSDLLDQMNVFFDGCRFLNDWNDIFDVNVMRNGGSWLLYGCRKPDDTHSWTVTTVIPVKGDNYRPQEDFEELVRLLSIRKVPTSADFVWKHDSVETRKRHHSEISNGIINDFSKEYLNRILNQHMTKSKSSNHKFECDWIVAQDEKMIRLCPVGS